MTLSGVCTCEFWCYAFYNKCCFCLPNTCPLTCMMCWRNFQNFLYCLHKYLCIITAIPRGILGFIHKILCCFMLYLLLGALAVLLIYLLRTFCIEVIDFLDFLFVSGGGGGIFPFLRSSSSFIASAQYTWNTYVPFISPLIVMSIDASLSVFEKLSDQIPEQELEELFLNLINSYSCISNILYKILEITSESSREELEAFSNTISHILSESIKNGNIINESFDLALGSGWQILLPIIVSSSTVLSSSPIWNTYDINYEQNNMNTYDMPINSFNKRQILLFEDYADTEYYENANYYSNYNSLLHNQLMQYQLSFSDNDNNISKYPRHLLQRQQQYDENISPPPPLMNNKILPFSSMAIEFVYNIAKEFNKQSENYDFDHILSKMKHINNNYNKNNNINNNNEKQDTLKKITNIITKEILDLKNNPNYRENKLKINIKNVFNTFGFNNVGEIVNHIRETYGDGRGVLYSLAPHKHFGDTMSNINRNDKNYPYKSDIHFSDYLEHMNVSPKEMSQLYEKHGGFINSYNISSSSSSLNNKQQQNPGSRIPLQFFPPVDILDCFDTVPPDALCILGFIFPLPLDIPDFLDPVLDFDCECDDYDDNCFGLGLFTNSLLILKTLISYLSSIPLLGIQDFVQSLTIPQFIEDNFFITTPGDEPSIDDILCAILHLDCLIMLILGSLIILCAIISILKIICEIWKCWQDLRFFNEHNRIFDQVIIAQKKVDIIDESLMDQHEYFYINPCVRHSNIEGKKNSSCDYCKLKTLMIGKTIDDIEQNNYTKDSLSSSLKSNKIKNIDYMRYHHALHPEDIILNEKLLKDSNDEKIPLNYNNYNNNNNILYYEEIFNSLVKLLGNPKYEKEIPNLQTYRELIQFNKFISRNSFIKPSNTDVFENHINELHRNRLENTTSNSYFDFILSNSVFNICSSFLSSILKTN